MDRSEFIKRLQNSSKFGKQLTPEEEEELERKKQALMRLRGGSLGSDLAQSFKNYKKIKEEE